MGDDIRVEHQRAFQADLDQLHEDPGCTVRVNWVAEQESIVYFSAGIRVLSATPIFNRATGEIMRWRYWLLFAEMAILDIYGCGHPVHCFKCEVLRQHPLHLELKELGRTYTFLVCHNDPHEEDERQAAVYRAWAKAVEELGGEAALQALLDRQATQWTQDLLATREMKP
ncbi:MAG: hypothetical protein WC326_15460 [Candidatus Delongbacteria bacterium]